MKTVGEHIRAWLDEIGADGLMFPLGTNLVWTLKELRRFDGNITSTLVPAFRHADGSYHTDPEEARYPCKGCRDDWNDECLHAGKCEEWDAYRSWLGAHKEAKK